MDMFEDNPPGSEEAVSFEAALEQLQVLVDRLEQGDVPLEESVRAYADGMRLVRTCLNRLQAAETTIQQLQATEEGFELLSPETDEADS